MTNALIQFLHPRSNRYKTRIPSMLVRMLQLPAAHKVHVKVATTTNVDQTNIGIRLWYPKTHGFTFVAMMFLQVRSHVVNADLPVLKKNIPTSNRLGRLLSFYGMTIDHYGAVFTRMPPRTPFSASTHHQWVQNVGNVGRCRSCR